MITIPLMANSDEIAVTNASTQFALAMNAAMNSASLYLFTCSTNCWVCQGANPTATAGPGSMFWPANTPLLIDGVRGAKLAVIRNSADGAASLCPVTL